MSSGHFPMDDGNMLGKNPHAVTQYFENRREMKFFLFLHFVKNIVSS